MRRIITALLATLLAGLLVATPAAAEPPMLPGMDEMMRALMTMDGADFEQGWLLMMVHHH